jgi:large subunit ribosomal protein L24
MAAKIKKGDNVIVLTGKDKGRKGTVTKVLPEDNRLIVSGINMVSRHTKASQANPQGGIVRKEATIHVSNVAISDPKSGEATRVGFRTEGDKKVRYAKKSGEVING